MVNSHNSEIQNIKWVHWPINWWIIWWPNYVQAEINKDFLYKLFISLNVIHNHANHLPYFDISSRHTRPTALGQLYARGMLGTGCWSCSQCWYSLGSQLSVAGRRVRWEETQYQFCRDHNQAGRCPLCSWAVVYGGWDTGTPCFVPCSGGLMLAAQRSRYNVIGDAPTSHRMLALVLLALAFPIPSPPTHGLLFFGWTFVCFYPFLVNNQKA